MKKIYNMKENYIIEMHKAVDSCKANTIYTDEQLIKMKSDGEKIFNEIFEVDGKIITFDDNGTEKEVKVEIEKYVFGHNDFKIYCSDFMIKKAMKEVFFNLKKDEKIGHQSTNGYGTAFVLSYDLKNN